MVPYNQPANSFDLVKRLTKGRPDFVDQEIPFVLDHYRASGRQNTILSPSRGTSLTHLVSAALGCLVGIVIMWMKTKNRKKEGYDLVPTHR